jgi:hypothetical protein
MISLISSFERRKNVYFLLFTAMLAFFNKVVHLLVFQTQYVAV